MRRVPVVLGLLFAAHTARADLASHFGMHPRSMGLGGAYTAVAEDVAALYYNPAGLVQLQGMTIGAGFLLGAPRLVENGASVGMPTETSTYLHLGLPLSGRLKEYLAFGFSLNLPTGKLFESRLYQKSEPYFVMYDSAVQVFQLRVGFGGRVPWRPLRWLAFGAGLQLAGAVYGAVSFYAPFQPGGGGGGAADPDLRLEAWMNADVPTDAFFTGGAMAFLGRFRIGATYRGPQFVSVELPLDLYTRLSVSDTTKINMPVKAKATIRSKYHPQQVSLGVSYRGRRLLVSADLTWVDYTNFEIPYPKISLDIEQLAKDPGLRLFLGPNAKLLDPLKPQIRWTDMLVPRVGAEYKLVSWLTGRAGYSFERSPIRSTDLPTYDCDRHTFALGARASFLRPWGVIPGWLHLDLSVQELWYVTRSVQGSDVGGHVFGMFSGIELILL
ncbi:MAG: outer membrane protein transport protein [Deltaproteobacteria bacterium]|nr:outer membrane protein transport protein [Deltaproteobacteria bacterium]